jgi:short-subunit dehydrogenase
MVKRIVITGASQGIGAELARQLAQDGHQLVLSARHENELVVLARQLGGGAQAVAGDMTGRADVDHLRDESLRLLGHVDVWINNVGRGINRRVMDLTDDDLDQMVAINVKSALYGMQAIVPHFIERGEGHLINMSSFLSRVPVAPYRSAYSGAKAMLNILTENLRMDLREAHPNIHVSLVLPGLVSTDFARRALGGPPSGGLVTATPAQTSADAAREIVMLIQEPRAERYTNPALRAMVKNRFSDPLM